MQRRAPRATPRAFANPALMPNLATARPGWRRHLPPLLLLLALGALVVALARPQRTVAAPQRAATVMMVTDISGSMNATDVEPDRLTRRRRGRPRRSTDKLPDDVPARPRHVLRLRRAARRRRRPTASPVKDALDRLVADGGTAMGDALRARHRVRAHAGAERATAAARAACPAVIVLLSDGKNTSGTRDPLDVARQAQGAAHPDLRDRARHAERRGRAARPVRLHRRRSRSRRTRRRCKRDRAHHRRALLRGRRRPPSSSRSTRTSARGSPPSRRSTRSPWRSPAAGSCCCCVGGGLSLAWFGRLP